MHKNKNFGCQCQNFTIVLTWIFIFVFFFYFTNLGKRLGSIPSTCIQGYLARSNVYSCCWAFDLIFQIKSDKKTGLKYIIFWSFL